MQAKTIRRLIAVSFAVIAVAAVAAVTTGSFVPSVRPAQSVMVGAATGEYVDGVAVYRLPSVNVTISRNDGLARIAREDALALSAQAGPVAAAK